jgi:hypothetical protein
MSCFVLVHHKMSLSECRQSCSLLFWAFGFAGPAPDLTCCVMYLSGGPELLVLRTAPGLSTPTGRPALTRQELKRERTDGRRASISLTVSLCVCVRVTCVCMCMFGRQLSGEKVSNLFCPVFPLEFFLGPVVRADGVICYTFFTGC